MRTGICTHSRRRHSHGRLISGLASRNGKDLKRLVYMNTTAIQESDKIFLVFTLIITIHTPHTSKSLPLIHHTGEVRPFKTSIIPISNLQNSHKNTLPIIPISKRGTSNVINTTSIQSLALLLPSPIPYINPINATGTQNPVKPPRNLLPAIANHTTPKILAQTRSPAQPKTCSKRYPSKHLFPDATDAPLGVSLIWDS